MGATLESLPAELRCLIWSAVGEHESFDNLMMTSRQIRHDILRATPGALLSCKCPYNRPCSCGKGFEVDRLVIIVEGHCSERCWLKFHIYQRRKSSPYVWCVADLDTPLARVLRYYRPRETTVEFRSPIRAPATSYAEYMILRAKLFDVCEILGWFQQQRERRSRIYFSDSGPPLKETPSTSFWDLGMTVGPIDSRNPHLWYEQWRRIQFIDPDLWSFDRRPVVYETLLMPLMLSPDWRNAEVTFDREVRKTSTFNYRRRSHGQLAESEFFGYKLLSVTAWAYIDQLITDGSVKLGDNDLTPYCKQYDMNAKSWAAEKARRPTLQAAFHSSLLAMIDLGLVFDIILERSWIDPTTHDILEPLRSHIRRTRNLSSSNAFSKDHPSTEVAGWPWNLEPIRQVFLAWAQEDAGKTHFEWPGETQWMTEESAQLRFIRWREAHRPLWPKSWARNWPPLKKKNVIQDFERRDKLGFKTKW
ncbi:hypothetical protein F4825DRAFT_437642 [Nemania diffusa]|nr:hypothetical protein F4825DRAFT_437642 [Nemania diffusa]